MKMKASFTICTNRERFFECKRRRDGSSLYSFLEEFRQHLCQNLVKAFSRSAYGKTIYNAACYLEKSELLPLLLYVCSRMCVCVFKCGFLVKCKRGAVKKKKWKASQIKWHFTASVLKTSMPHCELSSKWKFSHFHLLDLKWNVLHQLYCCSSSWFLLCQLILKRESSNLLMMVRILTPISSVLHPVVAGTVSSLSDKNILKPRHSPQKVFTSLKWIIFDAFPSLNPVLNHNDLLMCMRVWRAVISLGYLWPRDPSVTHKTWWQKTFSFRDGMSLRTRAPSDLSSCCPHCPQAGKRRWTTWDARTMSTTTTALHSGKGPPTCMSDLSPCVFSFKIYFSII